MKKNCASSWLCTKIKRLLFKINAKNTALLFTAKSKCPRLHSFCCFSDPEISSYNLCKTAF